VFHVLISQNFSSLFMVLNAFVLLALNRVFSYFIEVVEIFDNFGMLSNDFAFFFLKLDCETFQLFMKCLCNEPMAILSTTRVLVDNNFNYELYIGKYTHLFEQVSSPSV
jgi:hypothetical protein